MTRREKSSEVRHDTAGVNAKCEIDNPLAHLSLRKLHEAADAFAERIHPTRPDHEFWRKAALVARYKQVPYLCARLRNLTFEEKLAIKRQWKQGFWEQPKPLRIAIVTLCLSAIIQGWLQTGLNGANLKWPCQLGLSDAVPPKGNRENWIFSGINSVLYFSASIIGCWLSDPLQSLILGRRGAIFFSACLCLAGAIGCACSQTWQQLLGCRIVLGAAMGAKASVTPIFGAEISPTHLRGALVMNWQLFDAFGLFLGFTANLIVSKTGDNSWRYEVGSAVIPTICLLTLIWTIPESPRWFLKKGRYAEAFRSFCAIRPTPLQAAAELFYANAQLQAELQLLQRSTRGSAKKVTAEDPAGNRRQSEYAGESMNMEDPDNNIDDMGVTAQPGNNASYGCLSLSGRFRYFWTFLHLRDEVADTELDEYQLCAKRSYFVDRIVQLFRIPRIRRGTTAALVMMISQQLCGINILQFYSTTFFRDPSVDSSRGSCDPGDSSGDSIVGAGLSLGFGLANFLFTFPIYRYEEFIDTRGRRFLLLSSYPGMILSMLAACLAYNIENNKSRLIVVVFFMFSFIFFYSWGQGPVPFAYSSEVFPQLNREAGMSFAVFANLFGCGIIALVVPQLTIALDPNPSAASQTTNLKTGESRLLGIFTCLNVVALILIFFFVPETAVAITGVDDAQGLNYISLEELNYIFSASTGQHVAYQMTVMVPWARQIVKWKWKTYVLRRGAKAGQRPEGPEPLFTWIQAEEFNGVDDGEHRRE